MKDKFVDAGSPLILLFLLSGLQDLTSSCSKLFTILLFLITYWTLKAFGNYDHGCILEILYIVNNYGHYF